MKVLTLAEPGDLLIKEVDSLSNKPDHAKIGMEYCGICGSDLSAFAGKNPTVHYPINGLGHEGVGRIIEVGDNSEGLKVGDRVAIEPYMPCMQCHSCAEGRYNNCVNLLVAGVHVDGVMAEEIVFPTRLLHKIPDSMTSLEAALVEPLTIGLHAAHRARVTIGDYVLITGAGPIGLLAALGVKNLGAIPILVDIIQDRLDFAKECGIEHVFNTSGNPDDLVSFLNEVVGSLPHAMLECTGSQAIYANMHDYVRHGGRIALVGWPKASVTINIVRCLQKELDLLPSRNSNKEFPVAMKMISSGNFPTSKFITKVIALEETEDIINDMIAHPGNYVKVIVKI